MLTWEMQMSIMLLITQAFVNFLAIHNTKHLDHRSYSADDSAETWL